MSKTRPMPMDTARFVAMRCRPNGLQSHDVRRSSQSASHVTEELYFAAMNAKRRKRAGYRSTSRRTDGSAVSKEDLKPNPLLNDFSRTKIGAAEPKATKNIWRKEPIALLGILLAVVTTFCGARQQGLEHRLTQRAWLTVKHVGVKLSSDAFSDEVALTLVNSGPSPALTVQHRWIVERREVPVDYGEAQAPMRDIGAAIRAIPFGKDGFYQTGIVGSGSERSVQWTVPPADHDKPAVPLIAAGVLDYQDVFGERHMTWYCYELRPPRKTFTACTHLNRTDSTPLSGVFW